MTLKDADPETAKTALKSIILNYGVEGTLTLLAEIIREQYGRWGEYTAKQIESASVNASAIGIFSIKQYMRGLKVLKRRKP